MPLLLLLLLTALPLSHQLPTLERQHQPLPPLCLDPLHHLAPETRCHDREQHSGAAGRRHPVYIMTEDDCPAKSVCLSDAEVASCPNHHQQQQQPANGVDSSSPCPPDSPVSLLEYSPLNFACPRRRCVRLACFQEFCRARRRPQGDGDGSSSSKGWKPLLLQEAMPQDQNQPTTTTDDATCHYLHCGCPFSEAQLFAEGCPPAPDSQQQQHQQLLILQADRQTGCPVKRCSSKLPVGVVELELFSTTPTNAAAATTTSPPPTPCPEPAVTCPANTSELTVANPSSGGCPLRICLLPELLTGGAVTTEESTRFSTSAEKSTTAAAATTAAQTETVTEATTTTVSSLTDRSTPITTETPPTKAVETTTESAEVNDSTTMSSTTIVLGRS